MIFYFINREFIKLLLLTIIFLPTLSCTSSDIVVDATPKKFEFDTSDNYLDNYFRSTCMITDLSGTSYTFAFLTLRPVIFFSPNEKIIQSEYENLNHFKNRKNKGVILNDFNDKNNKIAYFENDQSYYKNSILNTKKKLLYVNNSKMEIHKNISKILT